MDIPADGDWDAVLDLYEECVDEYVAAVKKAASGDLSAAVSYAKIAQKATELSEKLSGVNDELTPKQQKRYVSILNKMTEIFFAGSPSGFSIGRQYGGTLVCFFEVCRASCFSFCMRCNRKKVITLRLNF